MCFSRSAPSGPTRCVVHRKNLKCRFAKKCRTVKARGGFRPCRPRRLNRIPPGVDVPCRSVPSGPTLCVVHRKNFKCRYAKKCRTVKARPRKDVASSRSDRGFKPCWPRRLNRPPGVDAPCRSVPSGPTWCVVHRQHWKCRHAKKCPTVKARPTGEISDHKGPGESDREGTAYRHVVALGPTCETGLLLDAARSAAR